MNGVGGRMYNGPEYGMPGMMPPTASGMGPPRPATSAVMAPPGLPLGQHSVAPMKPLAPSDPSGMQDGFARASQGPNASYPPLENQMHNMHLSNPNLAPSFPMPPSSHSYNSNPPGYAPNPTTSSPPVSYPHSGPPSNTMLPPPSMISNHTGSSMPPGMEGHRLQSSQAHQPPFTGGQPRPPYSSAPAPGTFPSTPPSQRLPYSSPHPGPPQMSGNQPQQPPYSTPQGPYPGQPQQPSYPNQQVQQPRRLDPDAMPSPVQVIDADKVKSSETFRTDNPGMVPPLVTTKFGVQDCGSASPSYVRCATYSLPSTADMARVCQVPMAFSVKSLARPSGEAPPIIVDSGPDGPIRCKRCKAYMCPQFKFTDGGRRFQCVMCSAITDTPHQYFDHVDHMNQRVDKYNRPELCRGSYEFVATKDYCKNDEFPNPPAYIFAIDVSYNAVKSGLVELLCTRIKDLLDTLPCDAGSSETAIRVAFFTYDSSLHFYNLKSTLAQPQMLVVSDISDIFVPLQDGFLVSVKESRHVINSLLDQIPEMFADTRESEVVLGPVVKAAVQALRSAKCAGKLFLFLTTLPTAEAPGKLKNRDDRKIIATDKEKSLFSPAGNFYTSLAKECVSQGCCVDMFLFPNQYMDVATIGQVAQLTGGDIFKYNFFRTEVDGERFISNLAHNIQRDTVFDAILRVRTSAGIRAVSFFGALHMTNTTDVELAGLDCDKAVCVELKHDDKISEDLGAQLQIAVLYTSVGGQRRLRIHNVSLAVCNQIGDLYRSCEADVLINYFAKTAIQSGLQQGENKIREDLISRVSNILASYRKHCASPSSAGQLILPECLKLLPVYLNSVLKNDAIHSSHEISTDDKAYLRQLVLAMDVAQTQLFFYPQLLPVRSFSPPDLPKPIRCSEDRLNENEAYLLDNGLSSFLWIGNAIDPEWVRNVFGVQSTAQIDIDSGKLPEFENPASQQLRDMLEFIEQERTRHSKLAIIRQRDKLEPWFKHFLVEDRGLGGGASYVDFLCHIHKEIRAILA